MSGAPPSPLFRSAAALCLGAALLLAGCDGPARGRRASAAAESIGFDPSTPEPILLAHRGLFRHGPENTLPALAAAVELGLSIEFDVYPTRDGRLVVIHDPTVDRTTDGSGEVAEMTLAELQRLDAGSWFHPRFADVTVPSLEEVFRMVRERQRSPLTVALHLKQVTPGIEEQIADLVEEYDLLDQLFVFGQPLESSRRLKEANPRMKTIEVRIHDSEHFERAMNNPLNDGLWVTFIPTREEVAAARSLGKQVWLGKGIQGHRPDLWDRARQNGLDVICTDWPLACRTHWASGGSTR